MQISRECANELEAFIKAPDVKNVVIETPGQAALAICSIKKGFVEFRIPPADDSAIGAAPVELAQHFEQWGSRGDGLTRDFMYFRGSFAVFDVAGIHQELQALGLA